MERALEKGVNLYTGVYREVGHFMENQLEGVLVIGLDKLAHLCTHIVSVFCSAFASPDIGFKGGEGGLGSCSLPMATYFEPNFFNVKLMDTPPPIKISWIGPWE